MTNTEIDKVAKRLAFQDEKFLAKLGEKTVELLRKNVRTLELIETPTAIITESLLLVAASRIEQDLSREHAIHFLRKLADSLEADHRPTIN